MITMLAGIYATGLLVLTVWLRGKAHPVWLLLWPVIAPVALAAALLDNSHVKSPLLQVPAVVFLIAAIEVLDLGLRSWAVISKSVLGNHPELSHYLT